MQKKGLPDFYIELKMKPNKPSIEQEKFINSQIQLGNNAAVFYSLQEAEAAVLDWSKSL